MGTRAWFGILYQGHHLPSTLLSLKTCQFFFLLLFLLLFTLLFFLFCHLPLSSSLFFFPLLFFPSLVSFFLHFSLFFPSPSPFFLFSPQSARPPKARGLRLSLNFNLTVYFPKCACNNNIAMDQRGRTMHKPFMSNSGILSIF